MSNYNRKYPKVTGSWTYGHIVVPEKLIYIGSSDQPECCRRWNPSGYINTELQPYIEKHGWDNIEHIVFKDGLTPKQAEQLEDLLIKQAKIDGWCINKKGSGGEWRDNPVECKKQYREDHKEEKREYDKQYRKQVLSTTAGKIYNRVNNFNRHHPDRKLITPLEAKDMYELTDYIPDFIKNNDLL